MAAITVNITSATEVDAQGFQEVAFDLVFKNKTIVSHSLRSDVDSIKADVTAFAEEYKLKYTSLKKLKAGDTFDIEV